MLASRPRIDRLFQCIMMFLLVDMFAPGQSSNVQNTPVTSLPTSAPRVVDPAPGSRIAATQGASNSLQSDAVPTQAGDSADPTNVSVSAPRPATEELTFEILIGTGDLIEVSVYGAADYLKDVRVLANGEITLPMIGALRVAGLTTAQAEELIAKRLKDGDYFTDPRVSVIEKETVTQGISVLGEVQKPGVYPLAGERRLFDAISAAGGTTPRAGNNVSIIHRANPQKSEIVTLTYGKSSKESNVYVYPGDTIAVSKAGIVYVVGDVRLPGGFVMENSHMTILQAYAMAQGANVTAALDRAQLIRKSGAETQVISLKKILAAKAPDLNLQSEDIVFVPTSGAKVAGRRTLDAVVQAATGIAIYSRVP